MKEERKQKIEQLKIREDEDKDVRAKEMKLRMAQGKVNKLEKEIGWMKQQINNAYDVDNVLALENELSHNRQVINKLLGQNKGLLSVKKGQSSAMKKLNHDSDANKRLETIKKEIMETKQSLREKAAKIREKEKQLQEKQAVKSSYDERYRKLRMMLLKHKQSHKKNKEDKILINSMVSQKQKEDTGEDPGELVQAKLDDEAKYIKLHADFEKAIEKVEQTLVENQIKLRDESRIIQHNQRVK